MRLRVSAPELLPLAAPVRALLDSWMAAAGWGAGEGLRLRYRHAYAAVVVLAVRGDVVEGLGAYLPGVTGSPLVIVRPDRRRRGVGSRILERLGVGMPKPWTCSREGAALCRSVGIAASRVED